MNMHITSWNRHPHEITPLSHMTPYIIEDVPSPPPTHTHMMWIMFNLKGCIVFYCPLIGPQGVTS